MCKLVVRYNFIHFIILKWNNLTILKCFKCQDENPITLKDSQLIIFHLFYHAHLSSCFLLSPCITSGSIRLNLTTHSILVNLQIFEGLKYLIIWNHFSIPQTIRTQTKYLNSTKKVTYWSPKSYFISYCWPDPQPHQHKAYFFL